MGSLKMHLSGLKVGLIINTDAMPQTPRTMQCASGRNLSASALVRLS